MAQREYKEQRTRQQLNQMDSETQVEAKNLFADVLAHWNKLILEKNDGASRKKVALE